MVLAVALAGCAVSHATGEAAAAPSQADARYLALGDSFTIGTGATPSESFPARLVSRWSCPVELLNAGVDGFTTDDLTEVELPDLKSFGPTFVTLLIGANDIVHGESAAVYRAHVRAILAATHAAGVARVVSLPQPDWSLSPAATLFGTPVQLHAKIVLFNQILSEETRAAGGDFVDLFPLMEKEASEKMLAADGLHPSAAAYDAWADALARQIAPPCSSSKTQ
jgi:acyl-CoA thioesterase-1